MKILAIRGKNLASLAGEFVVDFEQEPLRSAGLFAISGPTGAGKSTLLDALCMALYENTPRLLKAGNGKTLPDGDGLISQQDAGNLLRRGTGDGYAEVDFVGTDGHSYRARWSVKRSYGRASGNLQPTSMSLHQLPQLLPIGGKKTEVKEEIVKRIGLKFEQFTRAVLLAQNEFSSFLKADDDERAVLLTTLTGTQIYQDISQRAFQRAKSEREALAHFHLRLADNKPLSEDERTGLEQAIASAQTQLQQLEQDKASADQALRWYEQWRQLQLQITAAEQAHTQATQLHEAAGTRRRYLQQIDAVQSARPLMMENSRLTEESTLSLQAIQTAQQQVDSTARDSEQAQQAWQIAQDAVAQAEAAQAAARPGFDAAKALDAAITAMQPTLQASEQAKTRSSKILAEIQQQIQEQQQKLSTGQQQLQHTEVWLTQHASSALLAHQWPAWDVLFTQAQRSLQQQQHWQQQNQQCQASLPAQQALYTRQKDAQQQAAQNLQRAQQLRDVQQQQLASFDASQLQADKNQQQERQQQLSEAQNLLRQIGEQTRRAAGLETHIQELQQQMVSEREQQRQAQAQLPACQSATTQAEMAQKAAEAACSADVENLRAQLRDDQPCPVCGACEHPYRADASQSAQLHALLATLQAQVQDCRTQEQQLREQISNAQIRISQSEQQWARESADAAQIKASLTALHKTWHETWRRAAWAEQAPPLGDLSAADNWLANAMQQAQIARDQLGQQEQAYHACIQTCNTAQQAWQDAQQAFQQHQERLQQSLAALTEMQHASTQANETYRQHQEQTRQLLDQLAPALANDDEAPELWREAWQMAPAEFHQRCERHAKDWLHQQQQQQQITEQLAQWQAAIATSQTQLVQAEQSYQQALQQWQTSHAALTEKQAQRQTLWNGEAVNIIETRLSTQVQQTRQALEQHAQRVSETQLAAARSKEAHAQALQRHHSNLQQQQAAQAALIQWLDDYAAREARLTAETLGELLAHDMHWIQNERQALQQLDRNIEQTLTIWKERQQQMQRHQLEFPVAPEVSATADMTETSGMPDMSDMPEAVSTPAAPQDADHEQTWRQRAAQLRIDMQQAQQQLASLLATQQQDQQKRVQAASLIADMQQQEKRSQLWESMNELIGHSEGKKFRNYAQQTTLDLLLAYANQHLHQLSRRYRLQRIPDTLAIMVIDQDMGDEQRSVHSLSGGESFLVSLALALGLASLSSNRIKVESLFIDEGFGSLDADTLRVAMDALDNLQAQGRKVGVISHVQEMTERIASKIMVQRTAGGRSLVRVC